MSNIKLFEVSKEASHWKDLSESEARTEQAVRISLIVGAIVLLIGTAIAIYYIATLPETSYWCEFHKTFHYISLKPLIILPVLLGGGISTILLFGGFCINFEDRHGYSKNLSEAFEKEELRILLIEKKIEDIYSKYYHKNGGIGPLVRQGFILPEQGALLRTLLEQYHEHKKTIDGFESQPLCKAKIDQNQAPEAYKVAEKAIEKINQQWAVIQKELSRQY